MQVNPIMPRYTKQQAVNDAASAGVSAVLSSGLTLIASKGKNPAQAARVGILAAGISLLIGFIEKAIATQKIKRQEGTPQINQPKIECHQG